GAAVLGGPAGIASLSLSDGRLLWDYPAPRLEGKRPELSAFRLASGRLFFLQENLQLFALNAATGQVLWTRWASSAFLRHPDQTGSLGPDFKVGERIMTVPELGEVLDTQGGKKLAALRVDRSVLTGLDPATGQETWRCQLSGPSTLSGEPVQRIRLSGESCLLIVPRNHGTTLERLDGGKPRWQDPVLLRSAPPSRLALSHDGGSFY